ncbi:AbrB/MazE/SpoVT family DNA-binding domain-containing protein [Candidatus Fukatsuia symbiotica]|uniref:Antitoxin ChpS n=1 Tax=Candidatus Fukatsuia symbiotica TaxID=1878942 RepID=A0A2U8I501_9GAMM|nr:AbrB/MazE/SpoVT family DNA-binding domain-containing protein [Candidatus Fukatsuia symbiotica]AWK14212.1 antitoxin ChpS [Candidatus Fukatsuia symbiotica]MEA9444455.1 AbrB/MazE/SpoVT family DNA-binding domain-containing protein [Candidatus Fukatsuia symbiotica]
MTVAIKKWGNSNGIVIPALFLKKIGVSVGQELDLEIKDGTLVLTPKPKRYTLAELIKQCDASAPLETEESVWGDDHSPVGEEIW